MIADDDIGIVLQSLRSEPRPTALLRAAAGGLEPVVASDAMRAVAGADGDAGLAAWFASATDADDLAACAAEQRPLTLTGADGTRHVMSVRAVGVDCYQLRAHDVSSTAVAGIISDLDERDAGVIFLDPAGRVMAVNAGFDRYFPKTAEFPRIGGTLEDLVRDGVELGYMPQSEGREDDYVREAIEHFLGSGPRPGAVLTGNGRWVSVHRLRFRNGATVILLTDVTDYRQQLEQLISFARNTRNMIFVRVEDGSPFARVWGRDARDILGDRIAGTRVEIAFWRDCIHPDDRPAYEAKLRHRAATGEPFAHEFRFIHPDTGEVRWMLENAWVTVDRASGRRYLDNYLLNITDRKLAEAEMGHREEKFREFAEMATDWTFEADADMTITWLSENFRRISGMSPSRFVGRDWAEITHNVLPGLPDDEVPPWLELLATWRRREPFRDVPLMFRFPGDNDRLVQVSGDPVHDHTGAFVGFRGVGRDVTSLVQARERAEAAMREAEAANRAKSEFIANMSHELRTPLNAIIGFANVMEHEMFGPIAQPRYREYAGDIAASGQHLLSLVNDLLDLSRIEADGFSLDAEAVNVDAEIDRALLMFRQDAGGRSLERLGAEGCEARADLRMFRQMLINLIGNAVKFTGAEGAIRAEVEALDGRVRIAVSDDGIGMSDEDIRVAMEPFGRAAGADVAGGTGLGLPLTRKLAELHGGALSIESAPGRGTRVSLELPLWPAAEARLSA